MTGTSIRDLLDRELAEAGEPAYPADAVHRALQAGRRHRRRRHLLAGGAAVGTLAVTLAMTTVIMPLIPSARVAHTVSSGSVTPAQTSAAPEPSSELGEPVPSDPAQARELLPVMIKNLSRAIADSLGAQGFEDPIGFEPFPLEEVLAGSPVMQVELLGVERSMFRVSVTEAREAEERQDEVRSTEVQRMEGNCIQDTVVTTVEPGRVHLMLSLASCLEWDEQRRTNPPSPLPMTVEQATALSRSDAVLAQAEVLARTVAIARQGATPVESPTR